MKPSICTSAAMATAGMLLALAHPAGAAEQPPGAAVEATVATPSTTDAAAPSSLMTPATTTSKPSTRPASDAGALKVLLLPLEGTGSEQLSWIGKGVQDDLLAELARPTRPRNAAANARGPTAAALQPILPEEKPAGPITPQSAQQLAEQAGAAVVIFGTYQVLDQEIRLTAQVMDARTGEYQGALKATGSLRDLFALQDDLARQARALLLPAVTAAQTPVPPNEIAAQPAAPAPGSVYGTSDLNQAVEAGHIAFNPPPPRYDSGYDSRSYWYNYSPGATSYYGYGYPSYYYYGSCYRPRSYCPPVYVQPYVAAPYGYYPAAVIGQSGYGYFSGFKSAMPANTQGYVPMTTR